MLGMEESPGYLVDLQITHVWYGPQQRSSLATNFIIVEVKKYSLNRYMRWLIDYLYEGRLRYQERDEKSEFDSVWCRDGRPVLSILQDW